LSTTNEGKLEFCEDEAKRFGDRRLHLWAQSLAKGGQIFCFDPDDAHPRDRTWGELCDELQHRCEADGMTDGTRGAGYERRVLEELTMASGKPRGYRVDNDNLRGTEKCVETTEPKLPNFDDGRRHGKLPQVSSDDKSHTVVVTDFVAHAKHSPFV
jgi:hypothetical protein